MNELRECIAPKQVKTETYTLMGKKITSVTTQQDPITYPFLQNQYFLHPVLVDTSNVLEQHRR